MNCSCLDCEMDGDAVRSVRGWQLTTQTFHEVTARIFADCSGDSVLAPLTGAEDVSKRQLMETGDIASVYTQLENPDNFYIGYIAHMSARHFAMRVMDSDGAHDGWLIGRNSDVMQVVAGDDYEVRMKWLETLLGRDAPADPLAAQSGEDLFADYARAAQALSLIHI